jgi:hypothetical protein
MPFTLRLENIDPEKSLCSKCEHGMIVNTSTKTYRHCKLLETNINEVVESCSAFSQKGALSLWQMKEVAWVLEVNKRTRKVGFSPPKDHGRKPKATIDLDGDLDYGDD